VDFAAVFVDCPEAAMLQTPRPSVEDAETLYDMDF
jgi:hypothetical protein